MRSACFFLRLRALLRATMDTDTGISTAVNSPGALGKLLAVAPADRGIDWEYAFLNSLKSSNVKVVNPDVIQGPDNWPYLMVEVEKRIEVPSGFRFADSIGDDAVSSGVAKDSTDQDYEPIGNIISWLSERGVGLVINPNQSIPDFVLTYGQVWNFRERGEFVTRTSGSILLNQPKADPRHDPFEVKHGEQVFVGAPSSVFLPEYVRSVLVDFFQRQQVESPKVVMVSKDQLDWELAFSLESIGNPPQSEHRGILEAISWFLPSHYSVILLSEAVIPGFTHLGNKSIKHSRQ